MTYDTHKYGIWSDTYKQWYCTYRDEPLTSTSQAAAQTFCDEATENDRSWQGMCYRVRQYDSTIV